MNTKHGPTEITAHIVNGFVAYGQGGNPAGVVIDADHLSEDQMLDVATKIGLSETAFVSSSPDAGFRLDFFTPNRRIAHCGHATIAAFSHLAQIGRVDQGETSKMTVDGLRKIIIKGQPPHQLIELLPDASQCYPPVGHSRLRQYFSLVNLQFGPEVFRPEARLPEQHHPSPGKAHPHRGSLVEPSPSAEPKFVPLFPNFSTNH